MAHDLTEVFAPITKREKDPETGYLTIYGKLTGPDLDRDGQRMDPEWLKSAVPEWFNTGANIRQMHQLHAVGRGVGLEQQDDDWFLTSKIVDPDAVRLIEEDVLTGYSIGIKNTVLTDVGKADAPKGRIAGGQVVESSIVDRPCIPDAKFMLAKTVGPDLVPTAEWVEDTKAARSAKATNDLPDSAFAYIEPGGTKDADGKTVPRSKRHFPIDDAAHVRNALARASQSPFGSKAMPKIRAAAKRFGISVSKAVVSDEAKATLGRYPVLTKLVKADADGNWTHDPAQLASVRDDIAALMSAELDELTKGESELGDVYDLLCALREFMCWWQDEAQEGEVPDPYTGQDEGDTDSMADVLTTLGVSPDVIKAATADDAPGEAKGALADAVRKALGADAESIKTAVTEVLEPLTKASTATEEAIKGLQAELAEVKQLAAPGGPVRTRPPQEAEKAAKADRLREEVATWTQKAEAAEDKILAEGYRIKARQAQDRLDVA